MKDQIICFFICMVLVPGLFLIHMAGAFSLRNGNYSLVSITALVAPVLVGALLRVVYPLSKVDHILSES